MKVSPGSGLSRSDPWKPGPPSLPVADLHGAWRAVLLVVLVAVTGCREAPAPPGPSTSGESARQQVGAALDALHAAASEADHEAYVSLFTEEAVFLGTDATERWTIGEFSEYARSRFEEGRGWTYRPVERHITLGAGGVIAWFDERLQNATYGETRGSGVVVLGDDGRWRVAQYNLTIPIPNALAGEFVERIREESGG